MKAIKWPSGLGREDGIQQIEAARFQRLKELREEVRLGRMTRETANKEWAKIAAPEKRPLIPAAP